MTRRSSKTVDTEHIHLRAGRDIPGGRQIAVELDTEPERVPGILLVPAADAPVPGALLLHGFTSRKERMAEGIGRALLRRGVASLAIDLPLHGAREVHDPSLRSGQAFEGLRNPLQLVGAWRMAMAEARQAMHFLAEHRAVDPRRLALVGYSLGSFLGMMVAAADPLVRAVVLAAGGDLPSELPFAPLVRTVADPLRAARKLAGRPLLMVNGRWDRTITAAQAERLLAAAPEPKEIRWYDGGHWPPTREIDAAAAWLADRLAQTEARRVGGEVGG